MFSNVLKSLCSVCCFVSLLGTANAMIDTVAPKKAEGGMKRLEIPEGYRAFCEGTTVYLERGLPIGCYCFDANNGHRIISSPCMYTFTIPSDAAMYQCLMNCSFNGKLLGPKDKVPENVNLFNITGTTEFIVLGLGLVELTKVKGTRSIMIESAEELLKKTSVELGSELDDFCQISRANLKSLPKGPMTLINEYDFFVPKSMAVSRDFWFREENGWTDLKTGNVCIFCCRAQYIWARQSLGYEI
jgi:hypothetical protein